MFTHFLRDIVYKYNYVIYIYFIPYFLCESQMSHSAIQDSPEYQPYTHALSKDGETFGYKANGLFLKVSGL